MTRRSTSIATPVAHLVGPGKLKVINDRLAFTTGQGTPLRLDPAVLRTLFCYGPVGISDQAFVILFQHQVEVVWMTAGGQRCRGRLVSTDASTTALRILQHQVLNTPACKRAIAAGLVAAKIESQVAAARHYQRQGCPRAGDVLRQLRAALEQVTDFRSLQDFGSLSGSDLSALRGLEGSASAAWFDLLGGLLVAPWQFVQRVRHPPTDPVNSLLGLGYTLLLRRTVARCEALGLETALGALHEFRPGRPSLGCDLMEPLRVPVVDRWVIAVCNEGQLAPDDFHVVEGATHLKPESFSRTLFLWEQRWAAEEHDRLLESTVDWFVEAIRGYSAGLPTPPEVPREGGGSGSDASDSSEGG